MDVEGENSTAAASTLRNRRRRARLKAAGIELACYELPKTLVSAVARVASVQNLPPSEFVTRILSAEMLRAGAFGAAESGGVGITETLKESA